ncbi:DMT family transporter [Halogranum rubrum]|uniref:EamA domain-containing protein n=1 Tax=Halogranum salarium B-1 TaxID=1210908 RepID=J3JE93_9EURY|nr:DMT family transporter [Halogranum salarium]EJN58166.1 hypothetical protein HSB1_35830 [Halogranum salarium B-1]
MKALSNLTKHRNTLLFVTLAFVWGTSFMAIKSGLAELPPVLFAALRYDIAGVLLLALAVVRTAHWRPRGRDEWTLVGVGGLLVIGLHFGLLFTGQQYVTSATGAIVLSTTPMLTPLFAWFLLPDERIGLPGMLGVLLGLAGVVVVANPDPSALGGQFVGVALMFLSAVSFAFGAVLTDRLPAKLPLATTQAWTMLLGAGLLHVLHVALGEPSIATVRWSPDVLLSLAYLAVAAGAGGFLIYFHLLDELGPVEISLVNYAVPVFAALAGWALLSESITATTVGGFALIFGGFSLMKWDVVFPRLVRLEARLSRGRSAENVYVPDSPAQSTSHAYPSDD